jgi:16S rRNA (guanine527-N7)-methyltransferase
MFHVKHEAWGRWGELLGLEIPREQAVLLEGYEGLLSDRAVPLGMIAESDRDRLRERHVVDSLRGAPLLGDPEGDVVDLGSGAGLPGIPLSIVRPELSFRLVEVRRRRAAFLELAVDTLGIRNVVVVQGPIERLAPPADVGLSRALADPIRAWLLAEPLLSPRGRLLYWAGRGFDAPTGTPEGVRISVSPSPGLADAGPIVIMTRQ